jgi:hypothetical protein
LTSISPAGSELRQAALVEDGLVKVGRVALAAHHIPLGIDRLAGDVILGDPFEVRDRDLQARRQASDARPFLQDVGDLAVREMLQHMRCPITQSHAPVRNAGSGKSACR